MTDATTPLRALLNKSGLPFQLAVEAEIRRLSSTCALDEVWREVPYSGGFIDVVARMATIHFVFECKRADEKPWLFICDPNWTNQTRCRLEWFNGAAPEPTLWTNDFSRVFCGEWSMVESSPEAAFCVVPKNSPVHSLESLGGEVLAGAHELMADEQLDRGRFAVAIPVIVTTAALHVCVMSPHDVYLETGELDSQHGTFETVDLVRFRKSLVAERSNSYETSQMDLRNWSGDRERTVFVMNPSALERFFRGFRSFHVWDGIGGAPKEYVHPPKL